METIKTNKLTLAIKLLIEDLKRMLTPKHRDLIEEVSI